MEIFDYLCTMTKNRNLHAAKRNKKDEFYTRLEDIERECFKYKEHFRGKTIFLNCDDATESKFFLYFSLNFEFFGLKRLISVGYSEGGKGKLFEYLGDKNGNNMPDPEEITITDMEGDGDFRSPESVELLKQADIVVTNPPFSLFREYIAQLVEYDKKFLVIGSQNAITYKEIFPLIKNNKIWLGYYQPKEFVVTKDYFEGEASGYIDEDGNYIRKFGNICWFTNLSHKKRNEELILWNTYKPEELPKYDNYDAIEVPKVKLIPKDYSGYMGVPITFLDKYNPDQFEICDANGIRINPKTPHKNHGLIKDKDSAINGKPVYVRIVIKNKNPQLP